VFVEYALNDGFLDATTHNPRVKAMERLIRRLLARPHHPAVALLQLPSHGQAFRRADGDRRPFHLTPEDQYGVLALYYDVIWISMRNAFLNRLGSGEGDEAEAEGGMSFMDPDGLHPNDRGHRAMADAAAWAVQQAAVGLALRPIGGEERAYLERKALPRPMHAGGRLVSCCCVG
jgi:hypothetical protein